MNTGKTCRESFKTEYGITVARTIEIVADKDDAIESMINRLDHHRGVFLSSSFEYPGRYTRWDVGFTDPPLVITARGRRVSLEALNRRGDILLALLRPSLRKLPDITNIEETSSCLALTVAASTDRVPEELRSRLPSVFSIVRAIKQIMANDKDPHLGLYGPFGYDLVFQFEPISLKRERDVRQRDLILYLPDEILAIDHMRGSAEIRRYDFEAHGCSTAGLIRLTAPCAPPIGEPSAPPQSDLVPGEYPALVEDARRAFARGDLFEVVLGQTFSAPCSDTPAIVFKRLKAANPAPYGALMNLGDGEYLVAASPEMFVRVDGRRIETCPLSGTIRRGIDAIEDADNIRVLLNSKKDESELTMCTDVDRNDKARVCEAESVKVIGRRQIELYSRLIHTADHVEGVLRPEFDALDGFLSHAWAVTVTGAPKPWAIKYIENHERSPRRWYGGALGRYTFDGNMNTGLTLRTIRIQDGIAEIRAGATLLHDSDPEEEEAECHLKASALLTAIASNPPEPQRVACVQATVRPIVLMVDHEDSFVHTLASYYRRLGAQVQTLRPELARATLTDGARPDLVVLSPGPGRPSDFAMADTIQLALERSVALFGVCLGLQGIVEYFGGTLSQLDRPIHGKPSVIAQTGGRLLRNLPQRFTVGRYHSLCALAEAIPPELDVIARTEDGVVMAVEHRHLPLAAVQFHPESMMMRPTLMGISIIEASLELGLLQEEPR